MEVATDMFYIVRYIQMKQNISKKKNIGGFYPSVVVWIEARLVVNCKKGAEFQQAK